MDAETVTAITTLIAALAAAVVSIVSAIRSKDNGKKVDAVKSEVSAVTESVKTVSESVSAVSSQAAVIHQATNGTLSRLNSVNDVLTARLEELEKALAAQKLSGQQAAIVARQAASDVQEALECPPPPVTKEV